jgi:predicted TIM-barrel fold metal-dependent hydrolase
MRGLEGDKRVSDSYFFPLYEEAGRLGLPVCVHSATGSFAVHEYFLDECGFNKFKLAVVGSFHSLIFNRVPEKFPDTKWGFIEVSSQWVPYAIHDYARRYERQGRAVDKSAKCCAKTKSGWPVRPTTICPMCSNFPAPTCW